MAFRDCNHRGQDGADPAAGQTLILSFSHSVRIPLPLSNKVRESDMLRVVVLQVLEVGCGNTRLGEKLLW
jgi:hypothetical protein